MINTLPPRVAPRRELGVGRSGIVFRSTGTADQPVVLPVLGNLAFPLQIAYTSRGENDLQAQFILYDGMSVVGRRLPIWGGADTLTEHVCNQLPDRVVQRGRRLG